MGEAAARLTSACCSTMAPLPHAPGYWWQKVQPYDTEGHMTKRIVLTLPALLTGPFAVTAISLTIYDFSVVGGLFTMAVLSFAAVRAVWSRDSDKRASS